MLATIGAAGVHRRTGELSLLQIALNLCHAQFALTERQHRSLQLTLLRSFRDFGQYTSHRTQGSCHKRLSLSQFIRLLDCVLGFVERKETPVPQNGYRESRGHGDVGNIDSGWLAVLRALFVAVPDRFLNPLEYVAEFLVLAFFILMIPENPCVCACCGVYRCRLHCAASCGQRCSAEGTNLHLQQQQQV